MAMAIALAILLEVVLHVRMRSLRILDVGIHPVILVLEPVVHPVVRVVTLALMRTVVVDVSMVLTAVLMRARAGWPVTCNPMNMVALEVCMVAFLHR